MSAVVAELTALETELDTLKRLVDSDPSLRPRPPDFNGQSGGGGAGGSGGGGGGSVGAASTKAHEKGLGPVRGPQTRCQEGRGTEKDSGHLFFFFFWPVAVDASFFL